MEVPPAFAKDYESQAQSVPRFRTVAQLSSYKSAGIPTSLGCCTDCSQTSSVTCGTLIFLCTMAPPEVAVANSYAGHPSLNAFVETEFFDGIAKFSKPLKDAVEDKTVR